MSTYLKEYLEVWLKGRLKGDLRMPQVDGYNSTLREKSMEVAKVIVKLQKENENKN